MDKITELDISYERFFNHLKEYIPEGIQEVNLEFLHRFHLLYNHTLHPSAKLTRFFHVVETKEKVTLFNDQFVVWIVPEKTNEEATTLVLVGIQHPTQNEDSPTSIKLETAFSTYGVYNTSRIVLRVVEKILADIQENEEIISRLENSQP